jgi:hypothetical protein
MRFPTKNPQADSTILQVSCKPANASTGNMGTDVQLSLLLPPGEQFKPRGVNLAWVMLRYPGNSNWPLVTPTKSAQDVAPDLPDASKRKAAGLTFDSTHLGFMLSKRAVAADWEPKSGAKRRSDFDLSSLNSTSSAGQPPASFWLARNCGLPTGN